MWDEFRYPEDYCWSPAAQIAQGLTESGTKSTFPALDIDFDWIRMGLGRIESDWVRLDGKRTGFAAPMPCGASSSTVQKVT